jgi:hypothetical protein
VTRPTTVSRRLVLGLAALAALAVVVAASDVNPAAILAELASADPVWLALALATSLLAQLAWGTVTALFLRAPAPDASPDRIRVGYLSGTFAKQVLPFGHAGGVPLLAFVLAGDLDVPYRQVLPSVAASELLIFVCSLAVAAAGLVGFAATSGLVGTGVLLSGLALAALAGVAVALAFDRREAALRRGTLVLAALGRATLGRLVPRTREALSPTAVTAAVSEFLDAFDRATADRTTVVRAAVVGLAGWVLFALPFYFGFRAVGVSVPAAMALFVVPAGGLASILPTPGGLGGSEVGTTAAVVLLVGVGVDAAAAGVLLYRVATYWFVVAVGGAAALYLSVGVASLWRARTGEDADAVSLGLDAEAGGTGAGGDGATPGDR